MSLKEKFPIFISYAMEDGQVYAENLQNVLNGIGLATFVAHKILPVGFIDPSARMLQGVDECQYFVLILTPGACKSEPVKLEIDQAIKGKKNIIACKRSDVSRSQIPSAFIQNEVQRLRFDNAESLAKQVVHVLIETEHNFLIESGINRVFLNRHDPEYTKALERCFIDKSSDEILMLGLSMRDWFGREKESKYAKLVEFAIRRGVKLRVLLVDPTSETTRERALIEKEEGFDDDKKIVKSQLFIDMKKAIKWLDDPQTDSDTKRLIRTNIKTRFYDSLLSVYIIKTAEYMFIEQYHTGKLNVLGKKTIPDDWVHGGYVPVLMINNNSDFGRLMTDHFNNIWEKATDNNLEKTLAKIEALEDDPKKFRLEEFVKNLMDRCSDIKLG
jgi:hypothetical protein